MTPSPSPSSSTSGGPTAPCVGKPKKIRLGIVLGLIGFLTLIVILAIISPSGCQNTPPKRVVKTYEEISTTPFRLEKPGDFVQIETRGLNYSINWVSPTKRPSEITLAYNARGFKGKYGGDDIISGFVYPPTSQPGGGTDGDQIFYLYLEYKEGDIPVAGELKLFDWVVKNP